MEPSSTDIINPNWGIFGIVLLLGFAMIFLPKKYALVPLFIVAAFITLGQYVVIGPAHFTMLRVMMVFGFLRIAIIQDHAVLSFSPLDKAMIAWSISTIITYTILWQTGQAFANRVGLCFDTVGVYFLCRLYLTSIEDVTRMIVVCIALMIPLAGAMTYEFVTGKNLFYFLGGVPEISELRNGRVRCQGSFRHPILMGTFGATMLPIIISLWWQQGVSKLLTFSGIVAAFVIVICSGSSGALMASLYGILGLMLWVLKDHMRFVRWIMVGLIIALQLSMKSPVWYVLARLSSLTGGTGWHRAYLIDQAIRYFNEWWLIGTKVTAHWMPTGLLIDPTKADITNQYLVQGVNGGIITMILFIVIVVRGFMGVGHAVRGLSPGNFGNRFIVWAMGASLFAHAVSFISVSYFDQIQVFWFFLMAAIAISADCVSVPVQTAFTKITVLPTKSLASHFDARQ